MNSAQCEAGTLAVTYTTATSLSISWTCYDQLLDDQFEVNYQLHYKDQCELRGSKTDDPFHQQTTPWSAGNRQAYSGNTYQHSATLSDLLPHSTYRVYVSARQATGGGGYGYQNSVYFNPNPTTTKAGE